ncbi:MAG: hypothetical protein H3C38_12805 [Rhodospirillales bacterium]|nr:hypothetical protein [Rhodospirillales bacterium]
MSAWWTYAPGDLLLFSERTYYRMFELHNAALWPAQVVALALALAVALLMASGWGHRVRAVGAVIAACWLFVAWTFLLGRYAAINWVAPWFAALFIVEAALFAAVAVAGRPGALGGRWGPAQVVVFAAAVLAQPAAGLLAGRPWRQAEIFGLAPDPTAIATLGLLAVAPRGSRWLLLPLPVLWCAVSGATLWTMGAPDAWLAPTAAAFAMVAPPLLRGRTAGV